jgi:hypothetical protein
VSRATKRGRSIAEYAKTAKRPPSKRCSTCRDKVLAAHVLDFIKLRESPEHRTWQTWPWFRDFLRDEHGIDVVSVTTLYNHIRNCLGRTW